MKSYIGLAVRGICLSFGLLVCLMPISVSALENELDDETVESFRRHVEKHSHRCGSIRFAHILYEDEVVLVVELMCGNRESFEIVNLQNRKITFVERYVDAPEYDYDQVPERTFRTTPAYGLPGTLP